MFLLILFRQEAMAALKEAIQIAQETNDHVCLEHCLVSLCYNKALVTE